MKHTNEVRVYYSDTDSYGVVWHGSYVKWLEVGRVELSEMAGVSLDALQQSRITLPVVEMNIRYKSPAFFGETLVVETEIQELKKTSIKFSHTIRNKKTGILNIEATTTIVAVDEKGKLYRRLPEVLEKAYLKALAN